MGSEMCIRDSLNLAIKIQHFELTWDLKDTEMPRVCRGPSVFFGREDILPPYDNIPVYKLISYLKDIKLKLLEMRPFLEEFKGDNSLTECQIGLESTTMTQAVMRNSRQTPGMPRNAETNCYTTSCITSRAWWKGSTAEVKPSRGPIYPT